VARYRFKPSRARYGLFGQGIKVEAKAVNFLPEIILQRASACPELVEGFFASISFGLSKESEWASCCECCVTIHIDDFKPFGRI
jgi:hypothetical protein